MNPDPGAALPDLRHGRATPLLLILFAGSGAAALAYEVVWFHLLRLVVGSSAISLGFLLGSFMGGMCLGSILLPRWISARAHPLRVYALLELGIGGIGLAMPHVLPWLGERYQGLVGGNTHGATGIAMRGAVAALALLPPTMLMGATLPAIARWLDTSRAGLARLGLFYGANIVGAVAGTLVAGFWLLRVYDTRITTWVAAGTNVAVAVIALLVAFVTPRGEERPAASTEPAPRGHAVVYLAIAVSGFTALGAEVVWTRLLSLLLGATTYTFSLILAVFLIGLGIGSTWGSRLSARVVSPLRAFALCQVLLVPAVCWTAIAITQLLPSAEPTYVFQQHVYQNMVAYFAWDFARCAFALLPGPVLWGASFPLALAAAGAGHRDPGRLVGGLYAANTIGAILGALVGSLWLVGRAGTQGTQQILIWASGGIGAVLLLAVLVTVRGVAARVVALGFTAVALVGTPGLVRLVPKVPEGMIAFGRSIADWDKLVDYLWVAEGVSASVAVSRTPDALNFHVSGKIVASSGHIDMRLQRMLGHLPALIHGTPRSVLIVGCGAGVTAGTFVDHPSIRRIVVCEIEPKVIEGARSYLGVENRGVLDDPRTEVVIDDARHFLATTRESFDIITSDPIHPWVRGAAALYTLEYHELVKKHLAPGGFVTQWVPLYQADLASVKSQIGTFFQAFPHGTVWNSDPTDQGYDVVLLAQNGPTRIDVDAIQDSFDANYEVRQALAELDLGSSVKLLGTFAGRASELRPWLVDTQINDDVGLRLQYLAGLALDVYDDHVIYGGMKAYYRYPEGLFQVSPQLEGELRKALDR